MVSSMTTINLALQGGGSHGAFTWGVLDALLEDGRLAFEGISGASAGAMNAVALASGWATAKRNKRDPRESARECLSNFWDEVVTLGAAAPCTGSSSPACGPDRWARGACCRRSRCRPTSSTRWT